MSRLAKKPIECPKGVEVKVVGRKVSVKGPKGLMELEVNEGINVIVEDGNIDVVQLEDLQQKSFLGLNRSLVNNAVLGVSVGFEKKLELIGVGYKAALKGNTLDLALGFSHPNIVAIPDGISVTVEKSTLITIAGINKQVVGQFAATIRAIRPPEPYKGKGVKYKDEVVRRKAGKSAK